MLLTSGMPVFDLFRRAVQVLNQAGLQTPVPVREIVQSVGEKKAA